MSTKHFFYLIGIIGLIVSCESQLDDKKEESKPVKKEVLDGYVQKGPFINGSSVSIQELDDAMNQTGKSYSTTIINNEGNFEQKDIELISNYVQLRADGYYFNEVTGKSSVGQISLYALVDVSESNSANINVLTHLERARVEYLVKEEGKSFVEAKKQAQKEVLDIFNLTLPASTASESLNLTDNGILLAISCILQGHLSTGDMMELMAGIISDIRTDGRLDNQTLGSRLFDNAVILPLTDIRKNLEDKYTEMNNAITVPGFERYVRQFLENTSFQQVSFITYPAQGAYGDNILSGEMTSVVAGESYSMTADVPSGFSLKVVLKGGEWSYQGLPMPINWEANVYKPEIQEFRVIESGKLSDLRFYPGRGEWNSADEKFYTTVEFYENNSNAPVRTKKLEILPHIDPPDTAVIIGGEDIPFTDYILNSTCQWTNLNYDSIVVIPINSKSEMEKYITCSEGDFTGIDFSRQTLLLASGVTQTYGIGKFFKRLLLLEGKYILDVGIMLNGTPSQSKWIIAIVTDKIENTDIRLHVVAR